MYENLNLVRTQLDALLAIDAGPFDAARNPVAVAVAETAEAMGNEYDTRRLSGTLSLAIAGAIAAGLDEDRDEYAVKLIAVLSDLSGTGDEALDAQFLAALDNVPPHLIAKGREESRRRAELRA